MSTAIPPALTALGLDCQVQNDACGSHGERYAGSQGVKAACVYCGTEVAGWCCGTHRLRLSTGQVPCTVCGGPVKTTRLL
jgi:hypothetical protein